MSIYKDELLARLSKIQEACKVATSTEDTNLNLVIEEIGRLATMNIEHLIEK